MPDDSTPLRRYARDRAEDAFTGLSSGGMESISNEKTARAQAVLSASQYAQLQQFDIERLASVTKPLTVTAPAKQGSDDGTLETGN